MKDFSFDKYNSEYVDSKLEFYTKNPIKPSIEVLNIIHSCIDLTSLSNADNEQSIRELVDIVNNHNTNCSDIDNVAGICVYPKFVALAKQCCNVPNVDIVSVAGAFPHSQTFTEIKVREVELAVQAGADEIDVVITAGDIIAGNFDAALYELKAIRKACRNKKLKVILETGMYKTDAQIYDASIIAMQAGADFVKTSTGKNNPAATPRAVIVMAMAVKDYLEKTGKRVGIKPAGGIRSTADALMYYAIMDDFFGKEKTINKKTFRIGATSLAKNVINDYKKMRDANKNAQL